MLTASAQRKKGRPLEQQPASSPELDAQGFRNPLDRGDISSQRARNLEGACSLSGHLNQQLLLGVGPLPRFLAPHRQLRPSETQNEYAEARQVRQLAGFSQCVAASPKCDAER